MGMFDSVMVTCPKCGKLTEFQSKAGKRMLLTYEESHVPTGIAADLSGKEGHCDECRAPITCQSLIPLYGRVWAVESEEYDE
jgi:hypothetical protein